MKKVLSSLFILIAGLIIYQTTDASSNGRAGRTGGAGESSCSSCHGGSNANGSVAISSNIPAIGYTPGTTYTMTVTVTYPGRTCFGVDVISLNAANTSTGTMIITDATYTKTSVSGGRTNLVQKTPKSTGTFSFNWTAPAKGTGNVTFYYAGLACNGNGTDDSGDYTYTGNHTYPEKTCPLSITTQPTTQNLFVGATSALFISSSNSQTATYQWQENAGTGFANVSNGGAYAGATDDSLIISNPTQSMNNHSYRCVVTDTSCVETSNTAVLTVKCTGLNQQPVTASVYAGATVRYIVRATQTGLSYQWQENAGNGFNNISNGGVFSGADNDTLLITGALVSMHNNTYRCVISSTLCGDTSNAAPLHVTCLSFTQSPVNQTVNEGVNALFMARSNVNNATYQWQENTGSGFVNIANGGNYSGVNNDSLIIANTVVSMTNNFYRCVITGFNCSDSSSPAILTVNKVLGVTTAVSTKGLYINPNPATSTINVYHSSEIIGGSYRILNLQGQQLMTGSILSTNTSVEVSELNAGVYLIEMDKGTIHYISRWIKE
jgi:hypothetical protein